MELVAAAPSGRSIPAHAGEPNPLMLRTEPQRVYPRPRGGTDSEMILMTPASGLSPPTRGNQTADGVTRRVWRSIPAHAGEPG